MYLCLSFPRSIPSIQKYIVHSFNDNLQNNCYVLLFTIAKTWKQSKYPPTDEWIRKMWCIYTKEYYSAIKKHGVMPFAATWMDLEMIILSEVSQRKTNII